MWLSNRSAVGAMAHSAGMSAANATFAARAGESRHFVSCVCKTAGVLGCDLPPNPISRYLAAGKRIAKVPIMGSEDRKLCCHAALNSNRMLKDLSQPCHSHPSMRAVGLTYASEGG